MLQGCECFWGLKPHSCSNISFHIHSDLSLSFGMRRIQKRGSPTLEKPAPLSLPTHRPIPLNPPPKNKKSPSFWSAVFHRDRMMGRSLFSWQNRNRINDWVNAERMKEGLDHTVHPAMFNSRAKELWDELDKDEQDAWNRDAEELQETDNKDNVQLSEYATGILVFLEPLLISCIQEPGHPLANTFIGSQAAYRTTQEGEAQDRQRSIPCSLRVSKR